MRSIAIVFKKEMIDTLRDRRALIFMILIPLVVFPLVIQVMITVSKKQEQKAHAKTLRVAVLDQGNAVLANVTIDNECISTHFLARGALPKKEGGRLPRGVKVLILRTCPAPGGMPRENAPSGRVSGSGLASPRAWPINSNVIRDSLGLRTARSAATKRLGEWP